MEFKYPEAIVECDWLLNQLNNDNVRIYDCTTILHYTDDHPDKPYDVESGYELYKKSHIPGASFLNLQNDFSDNDSVSVCRSRMTASPSRLRPSLSPT